MMMRYGFHMTKIFWNFFECQKNCFCVYYYYYYYYTYQDNDLSTTNYICWDIYTRKKNSSCIPILRFIRAKKINKCDYWRNISTQCSFLQKQERELWFRAQLYTSLMELYFFQCIIGGLAFSKCLNGTFPWWPWKSHTLYNHIPK